VRKTNGLFVAFMFLGIASPAWAQQWSGIVAPSRAIDWTTPGVVGGIPTRPRCTTGTGVNVLAYSSTAADINAAIAGCDANHAVELGTGTFTLSDGITFTLWDPINFVWVVKNNVTLRGAGPDRTFLIFTADVDPSSCGGLGGDVCFINGHANWSGNQVPPDVEAPGNFADWTAGYAKGTTSITLGPNESMSQIRPQVGTLLILDQADDSDTDNGAVWVCQTRDVCSQQIGVRQGRPGRGQTQVVRVTAVNGNTFTISPRLYMPNWRASQNPGAWWSNSLPITGSGVEDLSLDHSASNARAGVFIYNGSGIWLKNIRSINAKQKHVWMYQSVHTTVRDSYFYGTQDAADESYGTDTFTGGDHLIENNIFEHIASPMLNEGGQGIVHAYNYAIDDYYTNGGWAPEWQQASSYQHAIGNAFILWEGNDGIALTADAIHGTSHFITAFRNYWIGKDPQGGAPSPPGKTQQTNAVQLQAFNRYYNIIGNVLGMSGYHQDYQWVPSSPDDPGDTTFSFSDRSIYSMGYSGNQGTRFNEPDPPNPNHTFPNDTLVKDTLFRWGNYDLVTTMFETVLQDDPNGVRWCGNSTNTGWQDRCDSVSEVPIGPFSNFIPPESLPNSFYLSAKPSWFGTAAWPAIGPEVTYVQGENLPTLGGHVKKIPARRCYENQTAMPYDPAYGQTVRLFNATLCYPVH
jgi:hypothetical protein